MKYLINKRDVLKEIKELISKNETDAALIKLFDLAESTDDYSLQNSYVSILKKLDSEFQKLTPLKVAVLASSTVDHFLPILKLWLGKEGFSAEFYSSEFNSVAQTVIDPRSELYEFKPDIVWIFQNHKDVKINVNPGADLLEIEKAVSNAIDEVSSLWENIKNNSSALIIQNNADLPVERVFGNFEANVPWSRASLLLRFNLQLASTQKQGVQIFDIEHLASLVGRKQWAESRFWYHSKHVFNMDAIGTVAFYGARAIASAKGKSKKCLVLDLDNTLWGGVIGDDGVEGIQLGSGTDGEAFVDFQKYILQLKNRGVILAVCSKNEEAAAKIPFESHPDMQLKLEDIAVFRANWNNKADNIREIAEVLNIGLDSLVFVDDNPAERTLVRKFLPMVHVPELPEDPTLYLRTLDSMAYFETLSFSEEDRQRSSYYKKNAERDELSRKFQNLDEFLSQLEMKSHYGIVDSFQLPRAVQLINKSNQFNLTTIRYTESDIQEFLNNPNYTCLYFKLSDRFGDNGLISVIILKQEEDELHIDTWVMSCRVLSRNMEEFIFNEIVQEGISRKCKKIVGRYVPTAKNKLVASLFKKLNLTEVMNDNGTTIWEKPLNEASLFPVFIEKILVEELL